MAVQIPLSKMLPALDRKDRDFYDNLTEEEQKAFSPFLIVKYSAAVTGSSDLENYYLTSTNKRANINLFDLAKHKKLQWLMLTTASPGIGIVNHKWIKQKKKGKSTTNVIRNALLDIYPTMKEADVEVLATLVTKKELTAYAKASGN